MNGYACTASGNRTAQLTAAGCDVAIPPGTVAAPSRSSTAVEVTYGAFSEGLELTVLHPRLTLGAASSTLRVLSPAACGPGAAAAGPAAPSRKAKGLLKGAVTTKKEKPEAAVKTQRRKYQKSAAQQKKEAEAKKKRLAETRKKSAREKKSEKAAPVRATRSTRSASATTKSATTRSKRKRAGASACSASARATLLMVQRRFEREK